MTFDTFCAKNSIPVELNQAFSKWLGFTKWSTLPEVEWRVLWEDFISEGSKK